MSKEQEKAALAHIDFLIEPITREDLGITSRDLGTQVLRLCGGFNDLQAELKKSPWIKITPETMPKENFVACLAVFDDGVLSVIGRVLWEVGKWKGQEKWITDDMLEYITHYQPIPPIPEKG